MAPAFGKQEWFTKTGSSQSPDLSKSSNGTERGGKNPSNFPSEQVAGTRTKDVEPNDSPEVDWGFTPENRSILKSKNNGTVYRQVTRSTADRRPWCKSMMVVDESCRNGPSISRGPTTPAPLESCFFRSIRYPTGSEARKRGPRANKRHERVCWTPPPRKQPSC